MAFILRYLLLLVQPFDGSGEALAFVLGFRFAVEVLSYYVLFNDPSCAALRPASAAWIRFADMLTPKLCEALHK